MEPAPQGVGIAAGECVACDDPPRSMTDERPDSSRQQKEEKEDAHGIRSW